MKQALQEYPLAELKLAYRALHDALLVHPELMDCALLADLQAYLQRRAAEGGVDATVHEAWDTWLRKKH